MRLICGAVFLDGRPVTRPLLSAMSGSLQVSLRPAQVATWIHASAGMAVLDFAATPRIVSSPSGSHLCADVRLDHPQLLRDRWGLPPDATEDEILSLAAESSSTASLSALHGDFAAALWQPAHRQLSLYRDALGIRPLVYHHRPGQWVLFASFERSILATGLVPPVLNKAALAEEVAIRFSADETLFDGIRKVRPGTAVHFTPTGLRDSVFWKPERQTRQWTGFDDAADELRGLITEAVSANLQGTANVATHLSGGLDSSALSVLAARELRHDGRTLHAFSYLAEPWPGRDIDDETPFVKAVLRQEQDIHWTPLTEVITPTWLTDPYHIETAIVRSEAYPMNLAYSLAAQSGTGILLSGWGGDEGISFNGRGALAWAATHLQWRYLLREARELRRRRRFSMKAILFGEIISPLLPPATLARLRSLGGRTSPPSFVSIGPESYALATVANPPDLMIALLSSPHLAARTASDALLAAHYGMSVGYPLLNRRVVDFALAMPVQWQLRNGWRRSLFRSSMSGILPDAIRDRDTKLSPMPRLFYEFLLQRDAIADRIHSLRSHTAVAQTFDLDAMERSTRALPPLEQAAMEDVVVIPGLHRALEYAMYAECNFPDSGAS